MAAPITIQNGSRSISVMIGNGSAYSERLDDSRVGDIRIKKKTVQISCGVDYL